MTKQIDQSTGRDRSKVLYFDIETHSASMMWDMDRYEFFRLGQFAWGDGEVKLTYDLDNLIEVIENADLIVGHNIHAFDLSVVYGKDSTRPLELSLLNRVWDTMVHANLVFPSRYAFTTRPPSNPDGTPVLDKEGKPKPGRKYFDGLKPEKVRAWLALDNISYQLGLEGKIADIKHLAERAAKEHGLPAKDPHGFGLIPLEGEFLEYAVQDVVVTREVSGVLNHITPQSKVSFDYIWREQKIAAIDAQNSRNGWLVDKELAQSRVDELSKQRDELLNVLETDYDFPTEGKSPWASTAGKEATVRILQDYGIDPFTTPNWTKTATGNISLGGEVIVEKTKGTPAEEVGRMLALLKGQRSLAQLALDSTHEDGRVHPDMTRFQRSGRLSITKPGLTVWTAHGENSIEKEYFLATPEHSLVSWDYSNADARVVAAYSGDTEFAKRFEPGFDSHELTARLALGDEKYDSDPKLYRNKYKPWTHAWNYGGQAKTLAANVGEKVEVAQSFIDGMEDTYPDVIAWRKDVVQAGKSGRVINDWGRVMQVDRDRSFTQSPALMGQSGTREIMCDALLRMATEDMQVITWLVAQVHDELIFDIPDSELWWAIDFITDMMETTFKPFSGGQEIEFPAAPGNPSPNWSLAGE